LLFAGFEFGYFMIADFQYYSPLACLFLAAFWFFFVRSFFVSAPCFDHSDAVCIFFFFLN